MKAAAAGVDVHPDAAVLARLNRLSLTSSFVPEVDIDWQETTTDEEFAALYPAWSLLHGSGLDASMSERDRIAFAKFQQVNLMTFTGLFEGHATPILGRLRELDSTEPFSEYVGHFIQEEIHHQAMFRRAVEQIVASPPGGESSRTGGIEFLLRWLFRAVGVVPGRRLRFSLLFVFFQYAEQITLHADQVVRRILPREKSLVRQVWSRHAIDESRHLVFEAYLLERCRLPGPFAGLPRALALPCCVLLSAALNANEVREARRLGVPVHLFHLPWLFRRTQAPFKRQVFSLLRRMATASGARKG